MQALNEPEEIYINMGTVGYLIYKLIGFFCLIKSYLVRSIFPVDELALVKRNHLNRIQFLQKAKDKEDPINTSLTSYTRFYYKICRKVGILKSSYKDDKKYYERENSSARKYNELTKTICEGIFNAEKQTILIHRELTLIEKKLEYKDIKYSNSLTGNNISNDGLNESILDTNLENDAFKVMKSNDQSTFNVDFIKLYSSENNYFHKDDEAKIINLYLKQIYFSLESLDCAINKINSNIEELTKFQEEVWSRKNEVLKLQSERILSYTKNEKLLEVLRQKRILVSEQLCKLQEKQKRVYFFMTNDTDKKLDSELNQMKNKLKLELGILNQFEFDYSDVKSDLSDIKRLMSKEDELKAFFVEFERKFEYADNLRRNIYKNKKIYSSHFLNKLKVRNRATLADIKENMQKLKEKYLLIGLNIDTSFVSDFLEFYRLNKLYENYCLDPEYLNKKNNKILDKIKSLENQKIDIKSKTFDLKRANFILMKKMDIGREKMGFLKLELEFLKEKTSFLIDEVNSIKEKRNEVKLKFKNYVCLKE